MQIRLIEENVEDCLCGPGLGERAYLNTNDKVEIDGSDNSKIKNFRPMKNTTEVSQR